MGLGNPETRLHCGLATQWPSYTGVAVMEVTGKFLIIINLLFCRNPTPSRNDLLPVAWVPVTESTQPYLNIDVEMKMLDNLFESRMKYWADFWSQHWMKNIILS